MDEFTKSKLKEWGFQEFIERFKEEEIDSTAFLTLTEHMIAKLIPKIGQQSKFIHCLMKLNEKQEFNDNKPFDYDSISFYDYGAISYDFESNLESDRCKYDNDNDRKYTSKLIIPKKEYSNRDYPFSTESTVHRKAYEDDSDGNDNNNDGVCIPSDIPLSKTTKTSIFVTEKIEFETVAAPDVRVLSAVQAVAVDTDLPYQPDLLERYKAVNIPNHSTFCRDQVLKNVSEPTDYSKENNRIAEPTGMLNLYKAITKFEREHNCKFTFLASSIGKDLRDYTINADLGLDPVHSVSNNVLDILNYPLRYGLIPTMSSFDFEMFLASIFLNNDFGSESTRRYMTGRSKKIRIDLIEGEIEALVFDYWSRSTVDLIRYDERVPRHELKGLLQYLYKKLCVSSTAVSKSEVDIFLTNFRKFAKFDLNDIIPASCLFFLKTKISIVWSEISPSDQTLWCAFFNELNVQHFLTAHTISAMFKTLDLRFEFIMSKAAQVRAFRGQPFPNVSLWHAVSVPRGCHYIVCEEDVVRLLPTLFRSSTDVESLLCTAIDNFYYYHIFLLSRYAILYSIDVATKILESTAVQGFLDEQHDCPTHKNCQMPSYVISHVSERMQSMMVSCFRRLYIRDSNKFEAEFEITEFEPTLYQTLNELICDRMNSALYPVIRKGQFSPEKFSLLHLPPQNVIDGSSLSSDHLCCYAFASLLYAHMYGLTRRENVLIQCDELNCNFKRDDKNYYDNTIADTDNVIKNKSSPKKKNKNEQLPSL